MWKKEGYFIESFANGIELDLFLNENCYQCKNYIHYSLASAYKPVCETEENIAKSIFDLEYFPKGQILQFKLEDGTVSVPQCINFVYCEA